MAKQPKQLDELFHDTLKDIYFALGLDDHVATRVATRSGTVFVAPAMNRTMWEKASTQRAVHTLREYDYVIISPETGIEINDLSESPSSLAKTNTIVKELLSRSG